MLFGSTHYRGEVWAGPLSHNKYRNLIHTELQLHPSALHDDEHDFKYSRKQPTQWDKATKTANNKGGGSKAARKSCDSSWFEGFRLSEHLNVFAGYKWITQVHHLLLLPASLFRKCPPKAQFWKNSSLWCHQGNWYLFQFSDSLAVVCLFFHCLRPTHWRLLFVSFQTGGNKVSVLAGN